MLNQTSVSKLKSSVSTVPASPGVYFFKDKAGKVIYIGKAKNLKARVRQYFAGSDERPQIPFLMKEAADLDYTVVNTELESLYLENTLIKQYLPKYNILLRDDKNYSFIKIDYSTPIPQIVTVRKIDAFRAGEKIRGNYFGPYSAAYKIRETLNTVRKIFQFCAAAKPGKACFYYHLHRCPGVCAGAMSLEDYKKHLEKIKEFIRGKTFAVHRQLLLEMKSAALHKKFERAARLRDQLKSLELFEQRQSVILAKKVSWDVVSVAAESPYACVNLFKVREGKLRDKENFIFTAPGRDIVAAGVLGKFLETYYLDASQAPQAVYIEQPISSILPIAQLLRKRFNKKIPVICPQKGKPRELIKLGISNAAEYLQKWLKDQALFIDKNNQALSQLKQVLNLPGLPNRIEGYDISNIQGTNPVGSMVVFEAGRSAKSQYRKFKIRGANTPNDFAMMREMLSRRMLRSAAPGQAKAWPLPDLIVIDGGKGQLSAALESLRSSPLAPKTLPIIGLAKKIEEIFLPNKSEPIILGHDQPALQLLQRLRDEAHRFGVTFHRALRSKQAVKSALDEIFGIGPKTKKRLKEKFGTVAAVRQAAWEDLAKAVGKKLAKKIKTEL